LDKAYDLSKNQSQVEKDKQEILAALNSSLTYANQAVSSFQTRPEGYLVRANIYTAISKIKPEAISQAQKDLEIASQLSSGNTPSLPPVTNPINLIPDEGGGDGEGCDRFLWWEVVDTNDGQFSECVCRGTRHDDAAATQSNTPKASVLSTDLTETFFAYSSSYHPTKPRYLHDKSARDVPRAKNAATLALGLPAKDAFIIRGEVYGMRAKTGAYWASDTIARVRISVPMVRGKSLDMPMWVLGRTSKMDRDGGQRTTLDMIPLGAMRLGDVGG
jgi:hypothetical protein